MQEQISLVARAESLLNRLVQVRAEEKDAAARSAVDIARSRAGETARRLERIMLRTPELVERGASPAGLPEGMRSATAKARTALRSTATSSVGEGGADVAQRVGRASVDEALKTADQCEKLLIRDLNRSVERRRLEFLPEDIEDRIVAQPGQSDALVVSLQRIQRQLLTPVDGLDVEDLGARLDQILENAATWAEKLPELDVAVKGEHPEVRAFKLAATSEEGAAWESVTPRVIDYLSDPENADYYRVRLR